MNVTVATNILVRAVMRDHQSQAKAAAKLLRDASVIAVTLPCLCEFVWVLRRVYHVGTDDICSAIRRLLDASNVQADRPAVAAGLALLEAGGDFADGIIAHEGAWLGGTTFVSFDKQAVALLAAQGQSAKTLKA